MMRCIRSILYPSLFITLSIVSCNSSGDLVPKKDNEPKAAASSTNASTEGQCNPGPSFVENLVKHGYSVSQAELMKKEEIPNAPDNIKAIKKLFDGKQDVFNTFLVLDRYHIKKHDSDISARFYCFLFSNKNQARTWFDTARNTPSKYERLAIFRKPKKLMALSKNHVYLVEGYHIADYTVLQFIVDQLPEVDAVFGPK